MLTRRRLLTAALAVPAAGAVTLAMPRRAMAAEPEIFSAGGLAIRGTDPVAYFDGNGPVAGSSEHSLMWKGTTWNFASAANRDAFEANPEQYAPIFGGYCAYAASLGYLAPTSPDAWTVYEGKLYLNANLRARELWLEDVPGNIAKGLANWPGILG